MLNDLSEDIVIKAADLSSVSEDKVKQDGVCLINNRIYIIFLGKITSTNFRLINYLEKVYMKYKDHISKSELRFPIFIEDNKIQKAGYLRDCNWFVVQADTYPLGSKTYNFTKSGFNSFDEAKAYVKKFLDNSISEDILLNKILSGQSVRELFIK